MGIICQEKGEIKYVEIKIAERLQELMKEEGLTQVKLASQTGIKQNTISAWLSKKKQPNIASLWRLADRFGVSVDFLIGRAEY